MPHVLHRPVLVKEHTKHCGVAANLSARPLSAHSQKGRRIWHPHPPTASESQQPQQRSLSRPSRSRVAPARRAKNRSDGNASSITVGTTDKVTTLDPAGSYDNGSFAIMNQVFPFLMNTPYGSPDVEPDIAESAEFTAPTEYTVTLKEGLTWANGNELTSSDVKFSFDRQLAINDANGPSSLLYNLASVEAPDDATVVFNLKAENDQIFPQILSSPAGPIVDEEVFAADAVTPDKEIVDGKAFAGQYTIASYEFNNLISFKANPDYQGLLGAAETATVNLKYYADSSNLKLDVQEGDIDVAFRSLSATDIADLARQRQRQGPQGPRWRDPLHRVQLQHAAVRRDDRRGRPRQGARRPPGRRRPDRPRGDRRRRSTRAPTRRCTPTCPKA